MILITIATGAYKPTNITGGLHIVSIRLALQKHEQLLQGRLKQLQKATGHHSILTAPGFGRLSSVQRAEILRQACKGAGVFLFEEISPQCGSDNIHVCF